MQARCMCLYAALLSLDVATDCHLIWTALINLLISELGCLSSVHVLSQTVMGVFINQCNARMHWGKAGWPRYEPCFDVRSLLLQSCTNCEGCRVCYLLDLHLLVGLLA